MENFTKGYLSENTEVGSSLGELLTSVCDNAGTSSCLLLTFTSCVASIFMEKYLFSK